LQAPSTRTPEPVTGDAPWALSAFPECFTQTGRARGPRAFVAARLPAGLSRVPSGRVLHSGDCTVQVRAAELRLARKEERLRIPGSLLFQAGGTSLGGPRSELVLLRVAGGSWEMRSYHAAPGARLERP
jgi:hypothetical protein